MPADITPYADAAYADTYHDTFIGRDDWCNQTEANKLKYLKTATRAIERLNFAGEKASSSQELQFPRGSDTSVPDDIQQACCELAWSLFDGVDPEFEMENLRSKTQGVGSARATYSPDVFADYIVAGIPSQRAWHLLVPYLRDPDELGISRVS